MHVNSWREHYMIFSLFIFNLFLWIARLLKSLLRVDTALRFFSSLFINLSECFVVSHSIHHKVFAIFTLLIGWSLLLKFRRLRLYAIQRELSLRTLNGAALFILRSIEILRFVRRLLGYYLINKVVIHHVVLEVLSIVIPIPFLRHSTLNVSNICVIFKWINIIYGNLLLLKPLIRRLWILFIALYCVELDRKIVKKLLLAIHK